MKIVLYIVLFISVTVRVEGQRPPEFSPQIQSLLDSGHALIKSGNHEEAFSFYEKAIQLDSTNIFLLEMKGQWESYLKYYDRALKTAIRESKLAPREPFYQFRVGTYYLRVGDSLNAHPYFGEAIRLCNAFLDTLTGKGNIKISDYKITKALATFFYGDEVLGNKLLFEIYKEEGEDTSSAVFPYLNKSKSDLLKAFFSEK